MIELKSIVEVDKEFHLQLYKGLGNPLVDNLIEVFWELFVRLGDAIPGPQDAGRGVRHMAIVTALQAGDVTDSLQRMQDHFADVRERAARLKHEALPST
jgi:DNA-binding FadR family transcriptional regulator